MSRRPYVTRREFMKESALAATEALILGAAPKAQAMPVNAKRAQVSLDGMWRFMPAVAGEGGPPKTGWGYIKVPGSWANAEGAEAGAGLPIWWPAAAVRSGNIMMGRRWPAPGTSAKCRFPAEWQGRSDQPAL